jgi:hypothetical protein
MCYATRLFCAQIGIPLPFPAQQAYASLITVIRNIASILPFILHLIKHSGTVHAGLLEQQRC